MNDFLSLLDRGKVLKGRRLQNAELAARIRPLHGHYARNTLTGSIINLDKDKRPVKLRKKLRRIKRYVLANQKAWVA